MHWGELKANPSSTPKVKSSSIVAKSQEIIVEGPKLHQPSAQQKVPLQQIPVLLCRPDITSLHTIQLLDHNRKVCSLFNSHAHGKYDAYNSSLISEESVPQLSTLKRKLPAIHSNKDQRGSEYKTLSEHTEISSSVARELGSKAVATVCAHAGYENSHESAVETLTDLLQEHLTNFCKLLRVAVDREALTGQTGFQDVLTQVLQEVGISSAANLYQFWKSRVKNYHKMVEKRTAEIMEKAEKLKQPPSVESVFIEDNIPVEDTFPAQIFALPEDSTLPNLTFESSDGSELGSSGGTFPSWYKAVKIEPNSENESGSHENSNNESIDDENGDSSSLVDGSSDIADVGSSPAWDTYQDGSPKKKRKK